MDGPELKLNFLNFEFSKKEAFTLWQELDRLFGKVKHYAPGHEQWKNDDFLPELKPSENSK